MSQGFMDVVNHELLQLRCILFIDDELRIVSATLAWWRSPNHGMTSHGHSILFRKVGDIVTARVVDVIVALGNLNGLACILRRQ